mgnify:CR=1 FL=1
MAFYHVGGCDCPVGCCDCGSTSESKKITHPYDTESAAARLKYKDTSARGFGKETPHKWISRGFTALCAKCGFTEFMGKNIPVQCQRQ